jgi:hypothetical protein
MFLVDNHNNNDPRINLALEEYCLRNLDLENDYLLLYVNEPSVIIGRHQNLLEEINHHFVMEMILLLRGKKYPAALNFPIQKESSFTARCFLTPNWTLRPRRSG